MHYDLLLFLVTLVARIADEDGVFPCFCELSRPMPPRYVAISRFVCWYLWVRFSRLIVSMGLGHFSDSFPKIIEIITLESRTDNYKIASEILAFLQGLNCERCG